MHTVSRTRAALLCCALAVTLPATADQGWTPLGFAQLTAEHFDGADGIDFSADRIRAGARYSGGPLFGGLVLDFNVPNGGNTTPGTLNNIIKDVWAGWRFSPQWSAKAGQFKAPVGMDFNVPGNALDITKRGMEKPLVLERAVGAMLSGRKLGAGFGVDVGIFNQAGRSGAVNTPADGEGERNAYAIRSLFDRGAWHAELSAGLSESAGAAAVSDDYLVFDAGLRYQHAGWTGKLEWVSGDAVLGMDRREQTVAYAHVGRYIAPTVELVARHYAGTSELPTGEEFDLGNTYLGVNWWVADLPQASLRFQANLVLASQDKGAGTAFIGGFRQDVLLLQLQIALKAQKP